MYNEILKEIRKEKGYTQQQIAKVLNTTFQYYSTYESGKREIPFSRVIELADFYNVSIDYIAGRSTEQIVHKKRW